MKWDVIRWSKKKMRWGEKRCDGTVWPQLKILNKDRNFSTRSLQAAVSAKKTFDAGVFMTIRATWPIKLSQEPTVFRVQRMEGAFLSLSRKNLWSTYYLSQRKVCLADLILTPMMRNHTPIERVKESGRVRAWDVEEVRASHTNAFYCGHIVASRNGRNVKMSATKKLSWAASLIYCSSLAFCSIGFFIHFFLSIFLVLFSK